MRANQLFHRLMLATALGSAKVQSWGDCHYGLRNRLLRPVSPYLRANRSHPQRMSATTVKVQSPPPAQLLRASPKQAKPMQSLTAAMQSKISCRQWKGSNLPFSRALLMCREQMQLPLARSNLRRTNHVEHHRVWIQQAQQFRHLLGPHGGQQERGLTAVLDAAVIFAAGGITGSRC